MSFVRDGSRHFGTQKSPEKSRAANSTRAPGLDPVSPKSRKTITKLGRTKWPPQPRKLLSELSQLPAGNCGGRNRYIAGFKIGQRGSLYFFTEPIRREDTAAAELQLRLSAPLSCPLYPSLLFFPLPLSFSQQRPK